MHAASLADAPVMAVLRVEDYDRAKQFYEETLGFTVLDSSERRQGTVLAGGRPAAFLYERPGMPAPENTTLAIAVDDIELWVSELRSRGVVFEEYESPELGLVTENGIASTGEGRSAWFKDSEGNYIALTENVS